MLEAPRANVDPIRRTLLGLAAAAALAGAGCGGDDKDVRPPSQADRTSTSARTESGGTETAETPGATATDTRDDTGGDTSETDGGTDGTSANGERAGGRCPSRSYLSSSFVGRRSFSTPFGPTALSGRGRGLRVEFRGRRWLMRGRGDVPMRGQAAGINGTVTVRGSVRGRLRGAGRGRYVFRQGRARGTVTLAGLGTSFDVPVSAVASSSLPLGRATIRCDGDRAVIRSRSGTLRLLRP